MQKSALFRLEFVVVVCRVWPGSKY